MKMSAQFELDTCRYCHGTGKSYDTATTGPTLRRLREEAGISLRAMAAHMNISPAYLSRLERGELKWPNRRVAQYIAKVL